MRILLSTIGSRGDVQPLAALGLALKAHGADVRFCVPPDFLEWIEGLGMAVAPIGPELKSTAAATAAAPPSPERWRELAAESVATQFQTIAAAAEGRDVIVGATALQIAAPSIAERIGIPYVFAAYCPIVLPSPHHAPPAFRRIGQTPPPPEADPRVLWATDAGHWNTKWGPILNTHRAALGLPAVSDLRGHVLTVRPWLAADPALGPWPNNGDDDVFQPGAWIVQDERPLPPDIDAFLGGGEPPVYFGFGSIRAQPDLARTMITSARAHGRRAIVQRGWANIELPDNGPDCMAIGEVNQQALFPRVAAAVHHGGAGTTTAAALAGAPQVVIPQMFDQFYWAHRVNALGIGVAHAASAPTAGSLSAALGEALATDVAVRARSFAPRVRRDGAEVAARRLSAMVDRARGLSSAK